MDFVMGNIRKMDMAVSVFVIRGISGNVLARCSVKSRKIRIIDKTDRFYGAERVNVMRL